MAAAATLTIPPWVEMTAACSWPKSLLRDRFPGSFRFRSFKMEFIRRAYTKLSILCLTERVPSLPTIGWGQWPPITRIVDAQIQKR